MSKMEDAAFVPWKWNFWKSVTFCEHDIKICTDIQIWISTSASICTSTWWSSEM